MSSLATSVETVLSSDCMLLSGVLCPNYSTLLNLKKTAKDDNVTKGAFYDIVNSGKYDSKNDLTFKDVLDDEFWNELSILDDQQFEYVWSAGYSSLSRRDSPSDFASKLRQCLDTVTANPLFPSMIPETVFKKPKVQTSEAGVETISTSIHHFPIASRTHHVPWGLDTDDPSPLTIHNITADHRYKSNKRKFEEISCSDVAWPPKKIIF